MWLAIPVLAVTCCGQSSGNGNPAPGPGPDPIPDPLVTAVLVGAGDIAQCDNDGGRPAESTARLLDGIPEATVFTAGDNAYYRGTAEEFATCYDKSWGRHKRRTRPSPGNHEYESAGAVPYFRYFGGNAGVLRAPGNSNTLNHFGDNIATPKGNGLSAPWFDPTVCTATITTNCFGQPANLTFGNLGPNAIAGPGFVGHGLSVFRSFKMAPLGPDVGCWMLDVG